MKIMETWWEQTGYRRISRMLLFLDADSRGITRKSLLEEMLFCMSKKV